MLDESMESNSSWPNVPVDEERPVEAEVEAEVEAAAAFMRARRFWA